MKKKKKRCGYQIKKRYKESLKKTIINDVLSISKKNIDDQAYGISVLSENDRLFNESNDVRDALLNVTKSCNDILVPNGYISVAILFMDLIKYSKSNLSKDSYIFPALFCFRQYLELVIKKSILFFRRWDTTPIEGESDFKTHNLVDLWNKLKIHITPIDAEVQNVERLIYELNEIDSDGSTFRYDYGLNNLFTSKKNKIIDGLINVDVLKTRMLQLYLFFDGIDENARIAFDNNNE